ncbi:MAG TPA: hypothetical protein VGL70_04090 [Candidatus Binatia bacterium]|jgi:hypothetical protein
MKTLSSPVPDRADLTIDEVFFDHVWRSRARSGEQRLMLAILDNAVDSFAKYAGADDERGKEIFTETEAWLLEQNNDWIFSFENVCETLGIDASYLRAGLYRLKKMEHRRASEKSQRRPVGSRPQSERRAA